MEGRRSRRRCVIAALVVAIGAIAALPLSTIAASAVGVQVSTDPALTPTFDANVTDYIVWCAATHKVTLSATVPAGDTLSVDGGTAQSGSITQTVVLYPGQALNWAIDHSGTVTTYTARCVPADFPEWTATVSGTPQAQWFMVAPSLSFSQSTTPKYVVIADARGTPVWWMRRSGDVSPIDQKLVTEPSGSSVVWADAPVFSPATYRFYDLKGDLVRSIGGDLDSHDLQRTASGTYIAMKYVPRDCPAVPADCVDESPWGGPTSVNPIDGVIVERDGSNNQLWSWSTRDHIALAESADWISGGGITNDIIHMNSIEPDGSTGIVFSARHLDAVYDISRATGDIDWKLGGTTTAQSLTVVGDTSGGPLFSGQHDARLLSDGTLTVHDNGTRAGRPPRALRFRLDLVNRTATVIENVSDPRVTSSACCGSARRLSGGDWVASWGGNSLATELTPAGQPVWTVAFAGSAFTYRAVPVEPGVLSAAALRAGMDAMPPTTFTAVTAAPNPATVGDAVTLTAAVDARAGQGAPTGTVQFFDGGAALGSPQPVDAAGTATLITSTLSEGTHSITAGYSGDSTFPASVSSPVSAVVNAPLSASVVLPADGSTLTGTVLLDTDARGPVAGVDYRLTGGALSDAVVGTATNSPYGWIFEWDTTTVPEGTYSLRARAIDGTSGVAYSPPITVTVHNLTAKMLIPTNGTSVSGTTLLDADAQGPATNVVFRLSGGTLSNAVIASATNSPYGWIANWDSTTVPDGNYTMSARATNGFGNTADSAGFAVTVANLSTRIVIPSNGAVLSGSALLDADAKGRVAGVQFRVSGGSFNDTLIGAATSGPYGWYLYWNTTKVAKGTYTLRSRVFDALGHSAVSAPITVTVGKASRR